MIGTTGNGCHQADTHIKLSQVLTIREAGSPNEPEPTTATFIKFERSGRTDRRFDAWSA